MSVIVVGASHRTAGLEQLERLAVPGDDLAKALTQLVELPHVAEAVLLSTCNRVEVYASVARFHPGLDEVRQWLGSRAGLELDELDDQVFTHFDAPAVKHLFRVAAGADSMIVGEQQIAVQLKDALELARAEGTARTVLQRVFQQAINTGRRVRRETEITSGARSMVDIGLEGAATRLGGSGGASVDASLDGRDVLIVGAGKLGSIAASRLADRPAGHSLVWNRSEDKAQRLAARVRGQVVESITDAMAQVEVVICTTGAGGYVIDRDMVAQARAASDAEHLVLVDLAMPRNVEPTVADLDGVDLVGLTDIRRIADRSVTGGALAAAEAIIVEEAAAFSSWLRAREVDPVIAALRRRAEAIRSDELERLGGRLQGLDDKQRQAVEALTRGIVNTLLHDPTVRLKELADSHAAEAAAGALRDLFVLDDGAAGDTDGAADGGA